MYRVLSTFWLALLAATASAQTPAIGKALYTSTCAAAGCHVDNPTNDPRSRLVANSPSVLSRAIASVGQMSFLASVLTTSDRADIAAYVGNPAGVAAVAATDAERLLNWAEWKLQTLLLPRTASQTIAPYTVRFYAQPNLYIGIANGRVYTYQPTTPNAAVNDIGTTSLWLGQASADGF